MIQYLLNLPRWWNISVYSGSSGSSSASTPSATSSLSAAKHEHAAAIVDAIATGTPSESLADVLTDQHAHDASVAQNSSSVVVDGARATVSAESN